MGSHKPTCRGRAPRGPGALARGGDGRGGACSADPAIVRLQMLASLEDAVGLAAARTGLAIVGGPGGGVLTERGDGALVVAAVDSFAALHG